MKKKELKQFFKIAGGIFFAGLGLTIFGTSEGQILKLVIGCLLLAIGFGLLFID